MTDKDIHRPDTAADQDTDRPLREDRVESHVDDGAVDGISHDAVREAARLGTTDAYLVDQDMEDIEQRQGEDGPDGRPSPLANADNPER